MAQARTPRRNAHDLSDDEIAHRNAEIVGDLMGEFLEANLDDIAKVIGDVPEFIRIPTPIKQLLLNRYVLGSMDVAVRQFVRNYPGLSPFVVGFLGSLSDSFFDRLRNLPPTASETQVRQAAADGAKKATEKIKEAKGKKERKLPIDEIEDQLDVPDRDLLSEWVLWMDVYDPGSAKEWKSLRNRIGTIKRLVYVLHLTAGVDEDISLPEPATHTQMALPINYPQKLRDTRKRISYLKQILPAPPIVETLIAAARGEQTPQTHALGERIEQSKVKLTSFAKVHRKAADRKKKLFG